MSALVRRLRRVRGGSAGHGQALAEFALAIPLVLLLLVAVFDVGRAVFAYNAITNAAREGARLAIVNQDVTSVRARTAGQASGIATTSDVSVAFIESATGDPCTGTGGNPALAIGCSAHVTVTASWRAITPLIGNIIGPLTFSAAASLPVEFVCGVASAEITNPASCPKQP